MHRMDDIRAEINAAATDMQINLNQLGIRAGIDTSILRKFMSGDRAGIKEPTLIKIASVLPEGSALRTRFAQALSGGQADHQPTSTPEAALGHLVYRTHAQIKPGPNYRKTFDLESLNELAASIKEHGLLQNIVIFPSDDEGIHELHAGERRWRAIKLLIERGDWDETRPIPCLIAEARGKDALIVSLCENIQRKEVSPLEEGAAFQRLMEYGLTTQEIAAAIHLSVRTVQDRLQLWTDLTPDAKEQLSAGAVTLDQARAIVTAQRHDQSEYLNLAIAHSWTGAQIRELVRSRKTEIAEQTDHAAAPCPKTDSLFPAPHGAPSPALKPEEKPKQQKQPEQQQPDPICSPPPMRMSGTTKLTFVSATWQGSTLLELTVSAYGKEHRLALVKEGPST